MISHFQGIRAIALVKVSIEIKLKILSVNHQYKETCKKLTHHLQAQKKEDNKKYGKQWMIRNFQNLRTITMLKIVQSTWNSKLISKLSVWRYIPKNQLIIYIHSGECPEKLNITEWGMESVNTIYSDHVTAGTSNQNNYTTFSQNWTIQSENTRCTRFTYVVYSIARKNW